MGKLGRFQKELFTKWGGVTKKNHINSVFQGQPQQLTNLVTQLLAYHKGKTLDTFLSQFPVKYFDSDDEYTWPIVGSAVKNLPLVEARDIDGNIIDASYATNVGMNAEPFYVVFAENLFFDGAVIVGELNEIYPLRILGDGRNEGTNTVFKVELMAGNTDGMPVEQLLPGKRFSKEYAPVERELSRKVDDITFASPTAMRNEFSRIRMQHKVSGAMINDKMAFGIPLEDENGKIRVVDMWMHNEQWVLEQQWSDAKNKLLAFGSMGAGLYEQMEYSNTMYYNTFSLKLIEDALYSIAAGKLDIKDRVFVLKTGERGAIQFHKAVLDTVSGWTAFTTNTDAVNMVRKANSPLHQNALSAGFQFVEFQAPNGVIVKVDVDPYYDDPVRNKIQHYLGGPAFSYRYDIFDIGTTSEPNIFKVGVKGDEGDYTGYEWGLRNPFTGQKGNPYMSHDEDSATIHKMATLGICVKDPTRTMSIIPAVLMG